MYIKLGFHNAKANLGRTIMAFLVTAAAALILTTSLSTSSGFLHGQHLLLRYYLGADIVVFPGKYVFEQGELQDANLTWQWSDYQAPWRNELPGFLLRLPQDGALQTGKNAEMVDMARVANFVQDRPEVDTVYPYYLLPSIAAFPHGGRNPSEAQGVVTPLRGRDPAVDRKWGIDKYLALDTATADEQTVNWEQIEAFYAHDGQPICIINPAALPLGVTAPRIGSTLTVYMPQFDATTQRYDWEHLTDHELYVAGHMQIPVSSYMVAERQHQPFTGSAVPSRFL